MNNNYRMAKRRLRSRKHVVVMIQSQSFSATIFACKVRYIVDQMPYSSAASILSLSYSSLTYCAKSAWMTPCAFSKTTLSTPASATAYAPLSK